MVVANIVSKHIKEIEYIELTESQQELSISTSYLGLHLIIIIISFVVHTT